MKSSFWALLLYAIDNLSQERICKRFAETGAHVKRLAGTVLFCLGVLGPRAAAADPRLDEKVYDPYVENGVAELETRLGGEVGGALGGETTTVIEAEYGLNDRVSLALVGALGRGPGEPARLDSVGVEAVAYVGQVPALGVDTGLYLEYARGLHGESDTVEAKLLFANGGPVPGTAEPDCREAVDGPGR